MPTVFATSNSFADTFAARVIHFSTNANATYINMKINSKYSIHVHFAVDIPTITLFYSSQNAINQRIYSTYIEDPLVFLATTIEKILKSTYKLCHVTKYGPSS
jgi:hypothetical protein